jgi:preprotein translocase subunit YajC
MKSVLLQANQFANIGQFVILGGIMIVFYFFMIRPQQKKQKDEKKYRDELKPGDEVVTIGGCYGKIVQLTEDTVILDVDRGVKLTFTRGSISMDASLKLSKKA